MIGVISTLIFPYMFKSIQQSYRLIVSIIFHSKKNDDSETNLYTLSYRYKLEVQHVWKGNPQAVEYEYQCRLGRGIGDRLWIDLHLWKEINKLSRQSPEVKLIFNNVREDSKPANHCVHMSNYDDIFTSRIQLGVPEKSHAGEFKPITPEDLLLYVRRYEFINNNAHINYIDRPVADAINALKLLGEQRAMYDYLRAERFMRCDLSSSSLVIMTTIIKNIPEFFASLYSRFRPLWSCADTMLRIEMFSVLSAIADRQTLNDMIKHVLQDDSAVIKRSVAYSTTAAAITYAEKQDMMACMLSSYKPDERMFAAVMMKRSIYWSHPDKMRRLRQAEPAAWQYEAADWPYDSDESDSIAQICQDLLQTLSDYSRKSSEAQALLDEFYIEQNKR
ncbi:MAG: hypothetical protein PF630_06615 [Gammaproteobacteria bacterium]|jgi:hypothetical protein|nr:hypothetical protein [Gammaproteobacteria bacterium]